MGKDQRAWLSDQLARASREDVKVVVALHHPVLLSNPDQFSLLAWDAEELVEMLMASPAFQVCVAGHNHAGDYVHRDGRHFVTLNGALDAPLDSECHAVLEIYDHVVELRGYGFQPSITMPLV